MINKELLRGLAEKWGIILTNQQLTRFDEYAQILVDYNKKINLTAIEEPDQIVIKHFLDSLSLLPHVDMPENATFFDIGAGAGFPSVPLAIVRQDLTVVQLEAREKKAEFLKIVGGELYLNTKTLVGRAEELAHQHKWRENFDIVAARAVADMRVLSELALPFVKMGGIFVAMKGPSIKEELNDALHSIQQMGGRVEEIVSLQLLPQQERTLIIIKKIAQTPPQFPRSFTKIKKSST